VGEFELNFVRLDDSVGPWSNSGKDVGNAEGLILSRFGSGNAGFTDGLIVIFGLLGSFVDVGENDGLYVWRPDVKASVPIAEG